MNKYLSIKTIVSIITGILIYFSLSIIGLDHAIMWGLIAFLLNYIPNIGSIIASIPAILIALIQFNIYYALTVGLVYLIVNIVMGSIIEHQVSWKRARSFNSYNILVTNFLGLVTRTGWDASFSSIDHDS